MIFGLGLDVCEISRMKKAMENPRFMERVFTDCEREYVNTHGINSVAGIFACKEAVAKALGTGFTNFGMSDIEVYHTEAGKPECRLFGKALDQLNGMGADGVMLSVTHDAGIAAAVCVLI